MQIGTLEYIKRLSIKALKGRRKIERLNKVYLANADNGTFSEALLKDHDNKVYSIMTDIVRPCEDELEEALEELYSQRLGDGSINRKDYERVLMTAGKVSQSQDSP